MRNMTLVIVCPYCPLVDDQHVVMGRVGIVNPDADWTTATDAADQHHADTGHRCAQEWEPRE